MARNSTDHKSQNEEEERKDQNWLRTVSSAVHHRIPITRWIWDYSRMDAVSDVIAGVTLGLTLIPQSIAYSSLAGVPPQYGLNSAFMGCFVYVLFGTIKEVSIGPTSLMALLTAEYTGHLTPQFVVALCFYVGCVEFLMGVLKLGFLVDFISIPVTSGFQTATSVIIIVSQMKGILGVRFKSCSFLDNVHQLFIHFKETQFSADFLLGVSCIVFLLLLRKVKDLPIAEDTTFKRVLKQVLWFASTARNFLAVVISAGIAYYCETYVGKVPFMLSRGVKPGLPPLAFPNLTPTFNNHTYTVTETVEELGLGIFIIPTVAVLANVAIAKAFITGGTIDATQEMLTLSFCNILGSMVQSMPTCGAFTRSAVASASGIRTPLAGLYSGILTMLALTFLTPYFHLIPRATLSAVLISAVLFLIDYQILWPLWKTNKRELCIVLVTLVSCLGLGVEMGLLLGVICNVGHLIYVWARPHIAVSTRKVYLNHGVMEYVLVAPSIGMFFPSVDVVSNHLLEAGLQQGGGRHPVVLDCTHFTSLDYTAAKALCTLMKDFNKRNQHLVLMNASPKMIKRFRHVGCKNIKCCRAESDLEGVVGVIPIGNSNSRTPLENTKENNRHEVIPLMDQRSSSIEVTEKL
ncbi:sodium-independent sulfate anion transporter-like [Macrosteles quadrilineatus]|uniref:sodium-independent sulfate anion transporter-like n=1 Tax=Macrosteles quadrilineatus TaxID=74068 RepID=UPI0023E2D047|nr:sodium-independent sulfate anion transporter-like [Macrosteles quadrilineatus]